MAYAETSELLGLLKIRDATDDQTTRADRALEAAAAEIDAEIDRDGTTALTAAQLELVTQVNLDRAIEHWNNPSFGVLGLATELGAPTFVRGDSWKPHAIKLGYVKQQFGFA